MSVFFIYRGASRVVAALLVCLGMVSGAQASEYWCDTGYLVRSDCSELTQKDGVYLWPVGTSIAIRAGECTACPTPSWGEEEETPPCDESGPSAWITQDGASVPSEWDLVKDTPCGPLTVLSTSLPPGDYVIQINMQEGWSVQHEDAVSSEEGCGITPSDTGSRVGFIALLLVACLGVWRCGHHRSA